MVLYHETFLTRVETILQIERTTSIHSSGKFSCICVEVDLQKPSIPMIKAKGYTYCVEYERLHLICFKWGKHGHKAILW
uniref:Uncharacterized protein n=1 Tax=Cajanus cajan TaxID=3821 RepID=A0A151TA87_CAJCA|nr:hypothetical protein KK1_018531 [Cajanus cajan]KYP63968.1 hypothetical protein KK1_018555 [Cajanus cajan]